MEELLKLTLDIEPVTWGSEKDAKRRAEIREAIKTELPDFNENHIKQLINECDEISITLNCHLINPAIKDIDNLSKIPIDAVFFSARNEAGYKDWKRKITSLTTRKIKSARNMLEIIIFGKRK